VLASLEVILQEYALLYPASMPLCVTDGARAAVVVRSRHVRSRVIVRSLCGIDRAVFHGQPEAVFLK